ncbi:unnamed protein product [Ectocarpus sp. 4 AP-2014]
MKHLAVLVLLLLPLARPWLQSTVNREAEHSAVLARPTTAALYTYNPDEDDLFHTRKLPELTIYVKGHRGEGKTVGGEPTNRSYLNDLVANSAAQTEGQLSNIAFIKTHKTASTTFAFLLYRYARRHNVKLAHFDGHNSAIPLREAVQQTEGRQGKGRCDIMHYHVSAFGQFEGSWRQAEQAYRRILRNTKAVNFVTVVREPRSHLLSYYYYFLQPQTQKSIGEFLTQAKHPRDPIHRRLFNPLSAEFGVKKQQDLRYVLEKALPNAKMILLTEEFDEGLMVLRRLLRWEMVDMTYVSVFKTTAGARRYDGKPLVNSPRFEDLPVQVQQIIDQHTELDRVLYNAAKLEYEKRRDLIPPPLLEEDLVEFHELQRTVGAYLEDNPTSKANAMYKTADIYAQEDASPFYEF